MPPGTEVAKGLLECVQFCLLSRFAITVDVIFGPVSLEDHQSLDLGPGRKKADIKPRCYLVEIRP